MSGGWWCTRTALLSMTRWLAKMPPDRAGPEVEIGFLVHPDLSVTIEDATATIARDGEVLLRICGRGALGLTLYEGAEEPARGWYSDKFGSKRPAPQLVFKPQDASCRTFEVELEIIPAPKARGESARRPKLERLEPVQ